MTIDRPMFLLLLLLLPVLWMWLQKAPGASRVALALKCVVFAVLAVALADPWAQMQVQHLAVTVVLDTSASMPRESLERGQSILRELAQKKSGAELRLITFAENARLQALPSQADQITIPQDMDSGGEAATDIEGALQLALSTFPERGARRVLLITDGNENRGDALAGALRASEHGVPVFTIPSGGTARIPVQLESIAAPQQVFSGERFTLSLALESSSVLSGRVWVTSQGEQIASVPVDLKVGANAVNLGARISKTGVSLIAVHIASGGSEEDLFSQAVTVRRPHVLYIAGRQDSSQPLLDTLKRAQVDVEQAASFPTEQNHNEWDAVLLDNYPDHPLPPDEYAAMGKYVFTGGGLIFIAGPNNSQLAVTPQTPLEKLLPVSGDPPPPPEEPTALVLVLDKSRSMDGPKIEMVRQAARASLMTLRPIDMIGVIAFDEAPQWVVPLGPASDVAGISSLISSITADGGTRIYPAVEEAFDAIKVERVTRRHIILLTDGVSPPGDLPQLEKTAAADHITVSTIGVGNDVDRSLLEDLARETRGKSYFLNDPQKIPQIISGDTRDLRSSVIEERPVRPVRIRPVEFTDGIDFGHAPRLLGFVKEKPRQGAETILRTETGEPLLVRWQYGLGRVIAFLSDARARWAADWIPWKSYGTLWSQMVRDVSHRDRKVRAGVRPGTREGESVVYYDVLEDAGTEAASVPSLAVPPYVLVTAPGGATRAFPLQETAPNHYEASIPSDQHGLYRVVSGDSQWVLPEAGFYRGSEEMKPQQINVPLLAEISRVTRGRMEPTIGDLLDDRGTWVSESRPLWPYLLVLALVLNFAEVAVRKGHFERLGSWLRRLMFRPRLPDRAKMIPNVRRE
ncbi:MAG TPA: VWA domain-containing protein [Candidatus Acidoferrales bacterium]|nr:VWA domain-containing protein [Candidatus Acidoferrales bacterium]